MSQYLSHVVNLTSKIEVACREIRECASQLAVAQSASTNSDYAAALKAFSEFNKITFTSGKPSFKQWCEKRLNALKAEHFA